MFHGDTDIKMGHANSSKYFSKISFRALSSFFISNIVDITFVSSSIL